MAHVYCPECGYNNPESAHFCAKCGAALVVPGEGDEVQIGKYRLTFMAR